MLRRPAVSTRYWISAAGGLLESRLRSAYAGMRMPIAVRLQSWVTRLPPEKYAYLPCAQCSPAGLAPGPQFRADMPAVFQNVMVTARRRGSPPTTMGIGGALKFSLARTKNH